MVAERISEQCLCTGSAISTDALLPDSLQVLIVLVPSHADDR